MTRNPYAAVELLEGRQLFAASPAILTTVVNPANGHTYHLLAEADWKESQAAAIALGGNLVTINDAAEQAFVWNTFSPQANLIWTGFNDANRDGLYEWVSGEPSTYTNWYAGEPNDKWEPGEIYATLWSDYNGQWNDLGLESPQGPFHFGVVEVASTPDLYATIADLATTAELGDEVAVAATIINGGNDAAGTAIEVQFFLSTDATLDSSDVLIGSATTDNAALPFDNSKLAAGIATIPAGTAAGRYRLLASVDAANAVAESDETNNVTASGFVDVGAKRTPVLRNLVGYVRDNVGGPLNGVQVAYGGKTVYTDYDSGSKLDKEVNGDFLFKKAIVGYNVSFDGAFSHFRPVESTDQPLVLTASDLTGALHTNTLSLAPVLPFDATKKDGGIDPFVATKVLTLPDYEVKTDAGAILLHKDLKNDRNSVRLQLKAPKQLAAGRRYRDTVKAVTEKLSALGLREANGSPLVVSPTLAKNSAAMSAIDLYQDILSGYAKADATSTAKVKPAVGVVDEAFIATLNAATSSTSAWTSTLPAGWAAAAGNTNTWINQATAQRLAALSAAVPGVAAWTLTQASPATGGTTSLGFPAGVGRAGADIAFGWINTAGISVAGQKFWEPVDGFTDKQVKLIGGKKIAIPNPADLNVTWRYRSDYNAAATQSAISAVLADGKAKVAFNDPQVLTTLGAITITGTKVTLNRADLSPAAGYDTQVGVRFQA